MKAPREWWKEYGIEQVISKQRSEEYFDGDYTESVVNQTIAFFLPITCGVDFSLCAEMFEKKLFLELQGGSDLGIPIKEEGEKIVLIKDIEITVDDMTSLDKRVKKEVESVDSREKIIFQLRCQWEFQEVRGSYRVCFRGAFSIMPKDMKHIPWEGI